jgi:putative acetyltransferase
MKYLDFTVRPWEVADRLVVAGVIGEVLAEYGLGWEPEGADRDVLEIEKYYLETGGEFWTLLNEEGQVIGSAGYHPISRSVGAVEIRKMYLLRDYRGRGLGRYVLGELEQAIKSRGFREIWIETASVLVEAVGLYENSGYAASSGVETLRCDRVYVKKLDC